MLDNLDDKNDNLEPDIDDINADNEILDTIEPIKILNDESFNDNSLKHYFHSISEFKPLAMEEEQSLGNLIRQGDDKALKKLVLSNLKFVVSVANKYRNTGVSVADLINQGNIGLLEAARRYNPEKGVKFITYAVWWIRQAIIQGLTYQTGAVKLPVKQANNLYKINSAKEHLMKELNREPDDIDISKATGLSLEDIRNISMVSKNNLSLDAPMNGEEDRTFLDNLEDENSNVENNIIRKTMKNAVDEIVEDLNEREKEIISKRFGLDDGEPKTLEEIGEELNISRERVRQLEARTLDKLRKKALRKRLNDYLN